MHDAPFFCIMLTRRNIYERQYSSIAACVDALSLARHAELAYTGHLLCRPAEQEKRVVRPHPIYGLQ